MKKAILILTKLGASVICLFTMCGFFGELGWIPELLSHFRIQYIFLLLFFSFILLFLNSIRNALIVILFLAINLWEIKEYFKYENASEGQLKITAINVLSINKDTERVLAFIKSEDPDIIILQEFTDRWEKELTSFLKKYPYFYNINRNDNFGIAIVSKLVPEDLQVYNFSTASVPSLVAKYNWKGEILNVVATHPVPPASSTKFHQRNKQFNGLATLTYTEDEYFILAGDFNATPYSSYFKKLKNDLNLKEAREGFGIESTWPTCCSFIQIPIDHILVSQNINVSNFYAGSYIGSDHYPVVAEIDFIR